MNDLLYLRPSVADGIWTRLARRLWTFLITEWGLVLAMLALAAVAFLAFLAPAWAQEAMAAAPAAEGWYAINVRPLLSELILAIGALLALQVPIVIHRVTQWIKAKSKLDLTGMESIAAAQLDKALNLAVSYGIEHIDKADWTNIQTKHQVVAAAANYAIDRVPELLKRFNVTPEALNQMLTARLMPHDTAPGNWTGEAAPAPVPVVQ